jgi:hypothetical protein
MPANVKDINHFEIGTCREGHTYHGDSETFGSGGLSADIDTVHNGQWGLGNQHNDHQPQGGVTAVYKTK